MIVLDWIRQKFYDKNEAWILVSFIFVLWSGCNLQGDEARLVPFGWHATGLDCTAIHGDHVPENCGCKCWIRCQSSPECKEKEIATQRQLMHHQPKKGSPAFRLLKPACSNNCQKEVLSILLNTSSHLPNFTCKSTSYRPTAPSCDFHLHQNSCCSIVCLNGPKVGSCFYFYTLHSQSLTSSKPNASESFSLSLNKAHVFSRRKKKLRGFRNPFLLQVLNAQSDFFTQQPLNSNAQLEDGEEAAVPFLEPKIDFRIIQEIKNGSGGQKPVEYTNLQKSKDSFSNISKLTNKSSDSNKLPSSPPDSTSLLPSKSEKVAVEYRTLSIQKSSWSVPLNSRENSTLHPTVGVVIFDVMNAQRANKSYLSQFTWEATVSLLYNDVYPGRLLGNASTTVRDGSNSVYFEDIVVSDWGYSYFFEVRLSAEETSFWNLSCLIGPFNVYIYDDFGQPLVDSEDFRNVKIVFDGDYSIVQRDFRKFEIFVWNYFGRKYSNVWWKNVSTEKGSIIVNAKITGTLPNLRNVSKRLENDVQSGEIDITFEGTVLKANQMLLPTRKLLQESSEPTEESSGGLSVAWIVAIVVNVVLILVFVVAIVYCYCRRKKKRDVPRPATLRRFDGGGPDPLLFGNKAEGKGLGDKAAIFTVEDGRRKLGNGHRDGRCDSARCYCSVGEGRLTEMTQQYSEENEDDPQGYPTPSPEPRFPTPEPSPEPEDFWRPDSYPQVEEPEEEDMFLPGAVEPSPEPPKEDRFYIYLLTDVEGSRELVGQMYLRWDSPLTEVRRSIDSDRNLSDVVGARKYRFLNENLDQIPTYQESSVSLERTYPSQGINIQFLPPKTPAPNPIPPPKPKAPAYVGPLGICNAPDCTRAAKIKCLDCRNVAYCTKRCMKSDSKDHKRACFKPAWRL